MAERVALLPLGHQRCNEVVPVRACSEAMKSRAVVLPGLDLYDSDSDSNSEDNCDAQEDTLAQQQPDTLKLANGRRSRSFILA